MLASKMLAETLSIAAVSVTVSLTAAPQSVSRRRSSSRFISQQRLDRQASRGLTGWTDISEVSPLSQHCEHETMRGAARKSSPYRDLLNTLIDY